MYLIPDPPESVPDPVTDYLSFPWNCMLVVCTVYDTLIVRSVFHLFAQSTELSMSLKKNAHQKVRVK